MSPCGNSWICHLYPVRVIHVTHFELELSLMINIFRKTIHVKYISKHASTDNVSNSRLTVPAI